MSENKKLDRISYSPDQSNSAQTVEVGGAIVHDVRNDGGEASGDRSTAERAAEYLKNIGIRPSLVAERLRDYHNYTVTEISGQAQLKESDLVEESISGEEGYATWTLIDGGYIEERSLPNPQQGSPSLVQTNQNLTQLKTPFRGRKIDFLGLIPEGSKLSIPENIIPFPIRKFLSSKKAA